MRFIRTAPPLIGLRRAWPVVATAMSLMAWSSPAAAGYYNVWSESGSGSITRSSTWGGSTTSISDPDILESTIDGSVSYTYTETWRYSWEPESDDFDDFPVPESFTLSATAQFDFTGLSSEEPQSATASGSFSLGDDDVTGSASYPASGSASDENNGIPQTATAVRSLSGWDGTFTVTYSGSISATGPVVAQITVAKGGGSANRNRYVYIVAPSRNYSVHTGWGIGHNYDVQIGWKWKRPFITSPDNQPAEFLMHLTSTQDPLPNDNAPTEPMTYVGPGWDISSWTGPLGDPLGGQKDYSVVVSIQWKRADGTWAFCGSHHGITYSGTFFSVVTP